MRTRLTIWATVGAAVLALAIGTVPASPAHADTLCYLLAGGTGCAEEGTPEAAALAQQQAWYYASAGLPDPGPTRIPSTTTTTAAPEVEMVCFILIGGSPCYPAGSPEAISAAEQQEAYLNAVADGSNTVAPATTVAGPEPVAAGEVVIVVPEASAPVETTVPAPAAAPLAAPAPSRPTLPETS